MVLRHRRERRGQGYAEYGLAILIVSFSAFATLEAMGYDIRDWYVGYSEDLSLVESGNADQIQGGGGKEGEGEPGSP